jgi:enterochelin esterase-like enzyme
VPEPLDYSLLSGAVPVTVTILGSAAAAFLLIRRRRSWWLRVVVPVTVGTVLATGVGVWCVDHLWRPFPDHLPHPVALWFAAGLAATGLAVANAWRTRWWRRAVAPLAAVLVLLTCAVQTNLYYGQYPALRNALGLPPRNMITLDRAADPTSGSASSGRVAKVDIPGVSSGFRPRPGWVYLPPSYRRSGHERLPVVILLAGQPGSPRDWFDGGRVDEILDQFAQRHHGLAPVVVVPDDLGAPLANPLCLDSRLGKVEEYLTRDVPVWIRQYLRVDPDTAHWAVAGYSHGGTCSLQLAVRHPELFSTFIDISGQDEPTLGSRSMTVAAAFGGDAKAFRKVNPRDILRSNRFPGTFAVLVAGRDDSEYGPQQRTIRAACDVAGMRVAWLELPGGHSWAVWGPGFAQGLDRIAGRLGLEQVR